MNNIIVETLDHGLSLFVWWISSSHAFRFCEYESWRFIVRSVFFQMWNNFLWLSLFCVYFQRSCCVKRPQLQSFPRSSSIVLPCMRMHLGTVSIVIILHSGNRNSSSHFSSGTHLGCAPVCHHPLSLYIRMSVRTVDIISIKLSPDYLHITLWSWLGRSAQCVE